MINTHTLLHCSANIYIYILICGVYLSVLYMNCFVIEVSLKGLGIIRLCHQA